MKNLIIGLLLLSIFSCRKDEPLLPKGYHIILVAGQSNTHYGIGYDSELDVSNPQISQLGRKDSNNLKIIPATATLEHTTSFPDAIGLGLPFARLFLDTYLDGDDKVLLIPAGHAGSSFEDNDWNKGNELYEDARLRVNYALTAFPGSKVEAIIWHQGESDVNNLVYMDNLDAFITSFRADIQSPEAPFILGGMVPYWVNLASERIVQQNIIKDTPNRISNTGYADPNLPIIIEKESNELNSIHYDAAGLRELSSRYFLEYITLRKE